MTDKNQYKNMGTFRVDIKVTSINDDKFKKAFRLRPWVDSGATFTQIPSNILEKLGVKPVRIQYFELADGRIVPRKIGVVRLLVEGSPTYDEVTFGDDNTDGLLGATTLEHLGLLIAPENQRLVKRERGIIQYKEVVAPPSCAI